MTLESQLAAFAQRVGIDIDLVLQRISALESGSGMGFDPDTLPLATDARPERVIVQQAGEWRLATDAQMHGWMRSDRIK